MKKAISVLLLCLMICSCSKVAYTESQNVEAVVVNKHYSPAFFTAVRAGNVAIPITTPANHIVYVKYKDIEVSRDDINLYGNYNIGDTIVMELISEYSTGNKMIKQKLRFKE